MSIAKMVALGVERQRQAETRAAAAPAEDGAAKNRVVAAMESVSAFIPSEVVGIYVAGFGILSPESDGGKWWIFFICLALIPLLIGLNYLAQVKQTGAETRLPVPFALTAFALIA